MNTPILPIDPTHIDVKLKLYGMLLDQFQKYNSILWQAPAALLAANILALDRLLGKPSVLLAVALFNLAFIFALCRVTRASRSLSRTMRIAEEDLRSSFSSYVPTFYPKRIGSQELLLGVMTVLDLFLIGYSIYAIRNISR